MSCPPWYSQVGSVFASLTELFLNQHPPLPMEVSPPQSDWIYRPLRRSLASTSSSSTFSPLSSSPSIAQIMMPPSASPSSHPRLFSPRHPMHHHSYEIAQRISQSAPQSTLLTSDPHSYVSSHYESRSNYIQEVRHAFAEAHWNEGQFSCSVVVV